MLRTKSTSNDVELEQYASTQRNGAKPAKTEEIAEVINDTPEENSVKVINVPSQGHHKCTMQSDFYFNE